MNGALLPGRVSFTVTPETNVRSVTLKIDGKTVRSASIGRDGCDNLASDGFSRPVDLTSLANGAHAFRAEVRFRNGASTTINATASVNWSAALWFTASETRANPTAFDNISVGGPFRAFVTSNASVRKVRFTVDGKKARTERRAPYDLGGTRRSSGTANPWNTRKLADGVHTLGAEVILTGGSSIRLSGTFVLRRNVTLMVSGSPSRSNAEPLVRGDTVLGQYVFIPDNADFKQVAYYVNGHLVSTIKKSPWDMGGTANNGNAKPLTATLLGPGPYEITAVITLKNGSQVTSTMGPPTECDPGEYGASCAACPGGSEEPCNGNGDCNDGRSGNGQCVCDPGWSGPACSTEVVDAPPGVPGGVTATAGDGHIVLAWQDDPATDLAGYRVYRDGNLVFEGADNTFDDMGLTNGVPYSYRVSAYDQADHESEKSAAVTGIPRDLTPPAVPTGLIATAGESQIQLDWSPVADFDVAGYRLYRDGTLIYDGGLNGFVDTGLVDGQGHHYAVSAYDGEGNESDRSGTVSGTAVDLTAPHTPVGLVAGAGDYSITLTWTGNTETDLGGYRLYRDGELIYTGIIPAFVDAGLTGGTSHSYDLVAFDASGNSSSHSALSSATACATGDVGQGATCVDGCSVNNGGCGLGASCQHDEDNALGCACQAGYSGDGHTCVDVDECATDNGGCDPRTACTNTDGASSCGECPEGYSGDGYAGCHDLDECADGSAGCGTSAACTNTEGAFTCTCDAGYAGDGFTCSDVDECATNNGGCDAHATCANAAGSFACACNTGYAGDGFACADIDECAIGNGGCDANATCTNLPGARLCTCNAGYAGNGSLCEPTGPLCHVDGATCTGNADCCSGSCDAGSGGGFCPNSTVQCSANQYCPDGSLCPSGVGQCQPVGPTCHVDGTTCSGNADCCSGNCVAGATTAFCPNSGVQCANGQYCPDGSLCPSSAGQCQPANPDPCLFDNGGCRFDDICLASEGSGQVTCIATKGSIAGIVSDENGSPLGGVTVTLSTPVVGEMRDYEQNPPLAETTTLADGTYLFESLAAGDYTVSFSNPGYLSQSATSITVVAGVTTVQNAVLAHVNRCATNNGGCDVNATCTDNSTVQCVCNPGFAGDGFHCVASADLVLTVVDQRPSPIPVEGEVVLTDALGAQHTGHTASDGTISFSALPPGPTEVTFSSSCGPGSTTFALSPGSNTQQFQMSPAVSDVFVTAFDPNTGAVMPAVVVTLGMLGTASSGNNGEPAVFHGVPVGRYLVYGSDPNGMQSVIETVLRGCTDEISIYMSGGAPPPNLTGTITDAITGAPLNGSIEVFDSVGHLQSTGVGAFFSLLAPHVVSTVRVTRAGYQDAVFPNVNLAVATTLNVALTPIDACAASNGGCDANATCSQSPVDNSVQCTCNLGFQGSGTTCSPIGPVCQADGATCGSNAECCSGSCVSGGGDALCPGTPIWCSGSQYCPDGSLCPASAGQCQPAGPTCHAEGAACTGNADCCSGNCVAGATTAFCPNSGVQCANGQYCPDGTLCPSSGGNGSCVAAATADLILTAIDQQTMGVSGEVVLTDSQGGTHSGQTASDGSVHFSGLPIGPASVSFSSHCGPGATAIDLVAGANQKTFFMTPTVTELTVYVVDPAFGGLMPFVSITVDGRGASTGGNGESAVFHDMPVGPFDVIATDNSTGSSVMKSDILLGCTYQTSIRFE